MSAPMLEARGLSRFFDGVHAVDDVSFTVNAGERVALIGPNGAGKSTCFNLVNGQLAPDAGTVWLAGVRIDGLPPQVIARRGVGRTFQVAATFASMTVRENLLLALAAHAGRTGRPGLLDPRRALAQAEALLDRVDCADIADAHCAALAYGDVKRVELALALADRPRLLLMDEPTSGMAAGSRLRQMRIAAEVTASEGIAVLFTEHDMDVVFGFADRVIVLDRGRILAQGTPDEVRADPRVKAVYLGEDAAPGS